MCSVQVVLFADVMGRSNSGLRNSGGVCRRLFSEAPSSEKAADPGLFLRAMELELRRRDTKRWNFDFEKERPLPGRYQWVAVGADDSSKIEQEVEIVDEVVRTKKPSSSILEGKRKSGNAGVATQAKITDFLRKRKRVEADEGKTLKMQRLGANLATVARPT